MYLFYHTVGSFKPLAELWLKDRTGLTLVMLEIDFVQLPNVWILVYLAVTLHCLDVIFLWVSYGY